jgi:hypothetical protein
MEPDEYAEHRSAIIKAQLMGLVEDDISAKQPERENYKPSPMEELRILQNKAKLTSDKADELYKAYKAAEELVEREKYSDEYDRDAAAQRLADADKAWTAANAEAVAAKTEWDKFRVEAVKFTQPPVPNMGPWSIPQPAKPALYGPCKYQGRCVCGGCAGVRAPVRFVFPSDREGWERLQALNNLQEKK